MRKTNEILCHELDRRQRLNPRYSLRAFAGFLDISPSHLSLILRGQKPITIRQAFKISDKLSLNPQNRQEFWRSLHPGSESTKKYSLKEDEFRLIKDWYHFAILNLARLPEHSSRPRWIAKVLGISPSQAEEALYRLLRLGLIEINNNKLIRIHQEIHTTSEQPSKVIRQFHKQILELAQKKIEKVPVNEREFGSVTLCISKKKLPEIKLALLNLKNQFCEEVETDQADTIYNFSFQFFPLLETTT